MGDPAPLARVVLWLRCFWCIALGVVLVSQAAPASGQSGGRIFFYEGLSEDSAFNGHRVMSGDGATVRDLPNVPVGGFVPSRNGSRVVFITNEGLFGADAQFAGRVLLAPTVKIGLDEIGPVGLDWSPSGELVAYAGPGPDFSPSNPTEGIVLVPSGGGARTLLPNTERLIYPSWAPDERRLVTVRQGDNRDPVSRLVIVDRVAGTSTVLFEEQPGVQIYSPQWSPDGSQIAYTRAADASPFARLWRVAADGTGARELVSRAVARRAASWSPDGQAIAFVGVEDDPETAGLYTVRSDGSGLRELRRRRGAQVNLFGWTSGNLAPLLPKLGKNVVAEAERGSVRVRRPGSRRFVELIGEALLPVGSTVDSRTGTVRIEAVADRSGRTQSGAFRDGQFKLLQKPSRTPVAELRLVGNLERCTRPRGGRAAARTRGRKLWGAAKGRFRMRGQHSAATVRGTRWLVADRCDGTTLTQVRSGRVSVRDFGRRRTVTLHAGQRHVAG